jgi:hypothetical protein
MTVRPRDDLGGGGGKARPCKPHPAVVLSDHLQGEATVAEDATKVAPHVYKVLFENEKARVLEVTMQPGSRK